jgi:hypothetical protein
LYILFTNHWYVGDPPLTGVGVNVTTVPEATGLALAAMETLGVTGELTTMVTVLEFIGLPEEQLAFEVMAT